MKKTSMLFFLLLAITFSALSQIKPKGAVLIGGSISADQIQKGSWLGKGMLTGGFFPLNNFAIGAEADFWFSTLKDANKSINLTITLLTKYYIPFCRPLFAQIGIGTYFDNISTSSREFFLYPTIGISHDIIPSVIIELSATLTCPLQLGTNLISSNLSLIFLLNNKQK